MPLLKISENKFPEWSELSSVSLLTIKTGTDKEIRKQSKKLAAFVIAGKCSVQTKEKTKILNEGDSIMAADELLIISAITDNSKILVIEGFWKEEIGNSGIFKINNSPSPQNIGDPVSYNRKTEFDNHFHDLDEYWFILGGSGIAVSENIKYEFYEGDCIATRMGDHHDLPEVFKEVHGVYFETTLKGKKRKGHLWMHTHGEPCSGADIL